MIDFIGRLFRGKRVSKSEPYPPPDTNGGNDILHRMNKQVENIKDLCDFPDDDERGTECFSCSSPLYNFKERYNLPDFGTILTAHHHCRDFFIRIRSSAPEPLGRYCVYVSGARIHLEYLEIEYQLKISSVLSEMEEFMSKDIQFVILEAEAYSENIRRWREKRNECLIDNM